MNLPQLFDAPITTLLGLVAIGAPTLLVAVLGLSLLIDKPFKERTTGRLVELAVVSGLLASIGVLIIMLVTGTRHVPIELGNWVHIHDVYHFSIKFVFDRLSVPFAILSFVLCGTVGAFANRYMHREPGFNRFFMLYAIFLMGMLVTSLADTIETLFAGWELVGLSSALLVAFYHERQSPVRNGLRVWSVYRLSDAALLAAALLLHHLHGEGDFDRLLGAGSWPDGDAVISDSQALLVGGLLVVAAAAKSALVPFSGWLPRAMEGPTPSSAVFYGALSVHLGAFLLLRVSAILDHSPALCWIVIALGLATSVFATFAGRVQTDIKSALSYASLTQVGIIVAEIGFGLRYIALIHIIGHGCLRTLQFLRAPTLLQDYRGIENALGSQVGGRREQDQWIPASLRAWFYRLSFDRGYLDSMLGILFVEPFLRIFRWCDAAERRWTDFLSGGRSRESDLVTHPSAMSDDLT